MPYNFKLVYLIQVLMVENLSHVICLMLLSPYYSVNAASQADMAIMIGRVITY